MMVAVVVAVIAALVLWVHHEPANPLPTAGRICSITLADSLPIAVAAARASTEGAWREMGWLIESVAPDEPSAISPGPGVKLPHP